VRRDYCRDFSCVYPSNGFTRGIGITKAVAP
jgi:hypothetical protein